MKNCSLLKTLPFLLLLTATACQPISSLTGMSVEIVQTNEQQEEAVWCIDSIRNADGTISGYGHPPEIQTYHGNPNDDEYYVSTECFLTWAEVIVHDTNGEIIPPADATAEDWAAAIAEHSRRLEEQQREQDNK